MIKISKKVEYALISLRHFANSHDKIITAKEISAKYNIPYDLLSKILQKLKRGRVLDSIQGIKGGYRLFKKLNTISLNELINIIEGETAIVGCLLRKNIRECYLTENCNIKKPINNIQKEFLYMLENKMVSEFI